MTHNEYLIRKIHQALAADGVVPLDLLHLGVAAGLDVGAIERDFYQTQAELED